MKQVTRLILKVTLVFACLLGNQGWALAACTDFGDGGYGWDTQHGNLINVSQTGGSITGTINSSCGTVHFSGTIDSSGAIAFITTESCNVAILSQMLNPAPMTFSGSGSDWNWTSSGNFPNNCDSVKLQWVGFTSDPVNNPAPSGDVYLQTYADLETTTVSNTAWNYDPAFAAYAFKAIAADSHGRHFVISLDGFFMKWMQPLDHRWETLAISVNR